ncbi:hypothetical protein F5J12DRAFT_722890, partial [Pisolithus orientalis]|uniref:uncharacterized protein n=1 Tax=Pisolithus orientalis TaxID=936130 RepID=UPI0022253553
PAIDAFGHALMKQFNKLSENVWTKWLFSGSSSRGSKREPYALVYVTHQAYLRRTTTLLSHPIALSHKKGCALGVRFVHGAYHPHEISSHNGSLHTMSTSTDPDSPARSSKVETGTCYNMRAPAIAWVIADNIGPSPAQLPRVAKNRLAHEEGGVSEPQTVVVPQEVAERCTLAQLYGKHLLKRSTRLLITAYRYTSFVDKSSYGPCHKRYTFAMKHTPYDELATFLLSSTVMLWDSSSIKRQCESRA